MNALNVPTIGNEIETRWTEAGPDFIVIGAQKGGTRWLYDQLAHHPDFWMPPLKELHHFDRPGQGARRAKRLLHLAENLTDLNAVRRQYHDRPLDERDLRFLSVFSSIDQSVIDFVKYKDLFSEKNGQLSGDITPAYSKIKSLKINRIVTQLPSTKFVFLARDPIDRLWSAVRHNMAKEHINPEMGLDAIRRLLAKDRITKRSSPAKIVKRWRKFVTAESFGLFFFDDLLTDAVSFRRNIINFLGGDPEKISGRLSANFNRKKDRLSLPMPQEIRVFLITHFAEELRACAAELGGPAIQWPDRYSLF